MRRFALNPQQILRRLLDGTDDEGCQALCEMQAEGITPDQNRAIETAFHKLGVPFACKEPKCYR